VLDVRRANPEDEQCTETIQPAHVSLDLCPQITMISAAVN
jgi:hypothetical protein